MSDRTDFSTDPAHWTTDPAIGSDVIAQTLRRPSEDPSRATLQLAGLTALPGWPPSLRIHVWHPGLHMPVVHGRMPRGAWVTEHDLHLERRADGSWRARGPLPAMAWCDTIPSTRPEPALAATVAAMIRNGHETLGLLATLLGHPGRRVRDLNDLTFKALHARIVQVYEAGQVPPGRWHLPRLPHLPHLPRLPRPPRVPGSAPRPPVSAPLDRS